MKRKSDATGTVDVAPVSTAPAIDAPKAQRAVKRPRKGTSVAESEEPAKVAPPIEEKRHARRKRAPVEIPASQSEAPPSDAPTKKKRKGRDKRTDGKAKGSNLHNPNRVRAGRGRPTYEPTHHDIEQVKAMAGYGLTEDMIMNVLGVSKPTWDRHVSVFADAMALGCALAAGRIGQSLFEQAAGGSLGHIIWWEKTRRGVSDAPKPAVPVLPAGTNLEVSGEGEIEPSKRIGIYIPHNGRDKLANAEAIAVTVSK